MDSAQPEHPYDRFAEAYRDWWGPILAPSAVSLLERLSEIVQPEAALDVVDVGAGTGVLALGALERWPLARAIGVDPSTGMMELARREAERRGPSIADRLRLAQGTAGDLPVLDASVDLAISSFAIQLVPSRAAAVREIFRVLRPGGHFACLTWQVGGDPFEPDDVVDRVFDELDLVPPDGGPEPRAYTSPAAAAAELRRAGFRGVDARLEWLEHPFTAESYTAILEHWIEDDLFAGLERRRRDRLRDRLHDELTKLDPEALVWRRPLVSVLGEVPATRRRPSA